MRDRKLDRYAEGKVSIKIYRDRDRDRDRDKVRVRHKDRTF